MSTETPTHPENLTNVRTEIPEARNQSPTSVFVVGTLFSGSTLMGRDITTRIKKAHYVGELHNFTQFPGISHKGSGRTCVPCSVFNRKCGHFNDAFRECVTYDDILDMHGQFARSLDASVIIDGSKYVAWLRHALVKQSTDPADRGPVSVIVTVRNPVAFALSHRNRTGEPLWRGAGLWRDTYVDALRTVNTFGLPHMVMRYEDYMANPERALERLSHFLHLPLRAEPDNTLLHDTGGNWSSFIPYVGREQLEKHFERLPEHARTAAENFVEQARAYWNDDSPKEDTRWHQSVNAAEANAILTTPGLTDTGSLIGYNVADFVHKAVRNA